MRRRTLIVTFSAAAAWSQTTRAQQKILFRWEGPSAAERLEPFRRRLRELGYIEGQNIIVEYRFAEGSTNQADQIADLQIFNADSERDLELARSGGEALGLSMVLTSVNSGDDLNGAFRAIESTAADALYVVSDSLFDADRDRVVSSAAATGLLAVYEHRAFAEAGGLMSYGPNLDRVGARAAWYVDRILKGARPSEIPVEQPTHFELLVNLKTARSMQPEIAT